MFHPCCLIYQKSTESLKKRLVLPQCKGYSGGIHTEVRKCGWEMPGFRLQGRDEEERTDLARKVPM